MPSVYDSFDYAKYWEKRQYEDLSEKRALARLFKFIPRKKTLADIGAGYGRHADVYLPLYQKIFLIEPSKKLLKQAKKKFSNQKKIKYITGKAEKLPLKNNEVDTVLLVRVSHHLPSLKKALQEINRILKNDGYLILEFANKAHAKAIIRDLFHKDLFHLASHRPDDLSSNERVKFYNYHPSHIKTLLYANGFAIKKKMSVSNFRNQAIKKMIPLPILLFLEFHLTVLTSLFPFHLGPSIFILAQKKK